MWEASLEDFPGKVHLVYLFLSEMDLWVSHNQGKFPGVQRGMRCLQGTVLFNICIKEGMEPTLLPVAGRLVNTLAIRAVVQTAIQAGGMGQQRP